MGVNTSVRRFACAQKCQLPVEVASLTAMMIATVLAKTLPDQRQSAGYRWASLKRGLAGALSFSWFSACRFQHYVVCCRTEQMRSGRARQEHAPDPQCIPVLQPSSSRRSEWAERGDPLEGQFWGQATHPRAIAQNIDPRVGQSGNRTSHSARIQMPPYNTNAYSWEHK
jgi:hypothetical protein